MSGSAAEARTPKGRSAGEKWSVLIVVVCGGGGLAISLSNLNCMAVENGKMASICRAAPSHNLQPQTRDEWLCGDAELIFVRSQIANCNRRPLEMEERKKGSSEEMIHTTVREIGISIGARAVHCTATMEE